MCAKLGTEATHMCAKLAAEATHMFAKLATCRGDSDQAATNKTFPFEGVWHLQLQYWKRIAAVLAQTARTPNLDSRLRGAVCGPLACSVCDDQCM